MQSLRELLESRRSVRTYSDREVPEDVLRQVLEAGTLAPSSKNIRPVRFVVVRDKEVLRRLARAKKVGAGHLRGAACAIVCIADTTKADAWVEDCSIAMGYMMLAAQDLGLGSCWVQIRLRSSLTGRSAEENVRQLLGIPEGYAVEAILALGYPDRELPGHTADELDDGTLVHWGRF